MKVVSEIIYILPDIEAGIASIIRNLIKYRPKSNIKYKVILTSEIEKTDNKPTIDKFEADEQILFKYSKYENSYAVFNRLKKYISGPDSIIVANDILELRLCNFIKLTNPLVYIIHGDFEFYYKIAELNQGVIDKFIAYSRFNFERLKLALNETNRDKAVLQYYPVANNDLPVNRNNSKVRVLFVGLLTERKGVDLLKPIYNELIKNKLDFEFFIIGSGDRENKLINDFFGEKNISFIGQLPQQSVQKFYKEAHILLLPTYSEGLPNVVAEAMKAGCVPIVSDIPSGIPDLIDHKIHGIKIEPGNISGFANAIIELSKNQELWKYLSVNAQKKSIEMFNPHRQAGIYENTILQVSNSKLYKTFVNYPLGGILDKKWLPNSLVKIIRKTIKISSL